MRSLCAAACVLAGVLGMACALSPDAGWQAGAPGRVLASEAEATHLGAPEGLRTTGGEYRVIPLKWDPVLAGDVAGYVVERALQPDGPWERLAIIEGRGRLAFIDGADGTPPLGDGVTRYYRLRAFDPESRPSAETSNVAVATTAPLPEAPEGIIAYSRQPREIPLTWRAVEGAAVGGYQVERSPAPEGPFEVVAVRPGRHNTSYVDAGLGDLRVFYYRVRTRNLDGGVGPSSEPIRAVTKPVPLPPMQLRVTDQRLGVNVLRWEPNVEEDLVEYLLFRVPDVGPPELVATVPVDELEAADRAVESGEQLVYAARARDRDGLVSTDSLPIPVTGEDYGLTAVPGAAGIELTWNPRSDEGYVDALVERRAWLETAHVYRSHTGRLLDEDVTPGRRYEYRVTLERLDGSRAPTSRPVLVEGAGGAEPPR